MRYCSKLSCCLLLFSCFLSLLTGCAVLGPKKLKIDGEKIPVDSSFVNYAPDPLLSKQTFSYTKSPCNCTLDLSAHDIKRTFQFNGSKNLHVVNPPLFVENKLIFMDAHGVLQAFDLKSEKRLWSTKLILKKRSKGILFPSPDFFNGGITEHGGILYVTLGSNAVKAVNIENGNVIWSVDLISPTRATPMLDGQRVLIQTVDNGLYALDKGSGEVIWLHSSFDDKISVIGVVRPLIYNDYALIQKTNEGISVIDLRDGNEVFVIPTTISIFTSLMHAGQNLQAIQTNMVLEGDLLFFSTGEGMLGCFDLASKKLLWDKRISVKRQIYVCGDFLYVLDQNDVLIAILKQDGKIKWMQNLKKVYKPRDSKDFDWLAPTMINGEIIITHSAGKTFAFDSINGEMSQNVAAALSTQDGISMPIIVNNGIIYQVYGYGKIIAYGKAVDTKKLK